MKDLAPLQYPQLFQGVFARRRERFMPLVEEARRVLHTLPVPESLRPFYDTVIRDNPQPSFLLLPLMFLATAEAAGGIQAAHRGFLPVMMLSMEACAISDDTVDRTPMRSGRPTFPMRFGEASTTPFVSTLIALVAQGAARIDPRLLEVSMNFFVELDACQLWERHNLYPTEELFDQWLDNRYRQSVLGARFGIDPALILHGRECTPDAVLEPFGRIFQDVDDIVNIFEDRSSEGENDDLLMGAVTRPLLLALDKYPSLRADLSSLWATCRAKAAGTTVREMHRVSVHSRKTLQRLSRSIRQAILEVGVSSTVTCVLADYRTCVTSAPPELRPVIQEMACTWVDRLRRCKGVELVTPEQIHHALEGVSLVAA
jgi:hypothetical protein